MPNNATSYAIAFYTEQIDFYERKIDSYWKKKDHIDTASLSANEIAEAVREAVRAWKVDTSNVSCWLPQSFSAVFKDRGELSYEALKTSYVENLGETAFSGSLLIATRPTNQFGQNEYLVTDHEHYQETRIFLENLGLNITSLSLAPSGELFPNPIAFDARKVQTYAPSVSMINDAMAKPTENEATITAVETEPLSEPVADKKAPSEANIVQEKTKKNGAFFASFNHAKTRLVLGILALKAALRKQGMRFPAALLALIVLFVGVYIFNTNKSSHISGEQNLEITYIDETNNPIGENSDQVEPVLNDLGTTKNINALDQQDKLATTVDDKEVSDDHENAAEDAEAEDEPILELGELPVSPYNFAQRPDDHAETAQAVLDALPNIVLGAPDFKVIERPANLSEHYALLFGPKINIPPTRNAKQLSAVAKIIEAKRVAEANTQTAKLKAPPPQSQDAPSRLPSAPTSGSLAQIATVQNVIDMQNMSLLGIFGPKGRPVAMIRSAGGQVTQAKKGDHIDGWQVVAISKSEVIVNKGGQQRRLRVPGS